MVLDPLTTLRRKGSDHANILIDLGRRPRGTLIDLGAADVTDRFYAVAEPR